MAHKVILEDGMEIPTRTFIWVSGVRANEIGNLPPTITGRGGRILVDAYNQVKGMNHVFCIGDQCLMTDDKHYPEGHPQLAQVAIQQGKLLAQNLKRLEQGKNCIRFTTRTWVPWPPSGEIRPLPNCIPSRHKDGLPGYCGWWCTYGPY